MKLRLGGYAPRNSAHAGGLEVFRESVVEATGGDVTVEVMWNILDLGRAAADLITMTEAGELFLCYFSTSYLGSRVPELNVLEIPYLFDSLDSAHRALDGALGEELARAIAGATGMGVLGYWDNGFRHFTNRLRPVRRPEDVAGMRVRLQPNAYHEAMIRGWSGVPVPVDLSRGIEMIRSGEVDAQENPLGNTVAYGVDRVHPHVTMTGHLYGARALLCHGPTLEAMDTQLRRVIESAARKAIVEQRVVAARREEELRAQLESDGVSFVDLDEEERRLFEESCRPVVETARAELGDHLFSLLGS